MGGAIKATAEHAVRAALRGRVQGVGMRCTTLGVANEHGVLGWVRNGEDGEVLIHAEGTKAGVDALLADLRESPTGQVDDLVHKVVEVEGHEQFAIRGVSAGSFAVVTTGSGFELGLEVNGATRAWALRKEPSMDPARKRMAFETKGGKGDGEIWDQGFYEQGGRVPWPEAIERGHAIFVLRGTKLSGGFALQRVRPAQWLLIKRKDDQARRESHG